MNDYHLEITEKTIYKLVVAAKTEEEAVQKAQSFPYWHVDSIIRQHQSTRALNDLWETKETLLNIQLI